MSLISLQDAHFDYGREHILRGVNVAVHAGVRCSLVGANGAGKTTLLAALAGELELQDGGRQITGGVRMRLLKQDSTLTAGDGSAAGLRHVVAGLAFAREQEIEAEMAEVTFRLADADPSDHDELVQRQGRLQEDFERRDGYSMQARLESALRGVGLPPATWATPVDRLSGGERRRAALAAVLLSDADALFLDEPTNHLDLASCEWLEGFLEQSPAACVIVSHDRHFLDRITSRTWHLDRGRLVVYSGNYSFFDEQRRLRYEQDMNAWQRQQNRFRQTEEYIRRNIEGQKTRQAQARRKQMAKEEKLERPGADPGLFRFALKPVRASGGTVLETEGLAKAYGSRELMGLLDLHISRGDRVGIVGPNGCGKSTLLKMLAGKVVPDRGRVVTGHNVDPGYYDQELASVSDHNTVIQEIASVDPAATVGELRSFLGAFGFGEDLYDRPVGSLSGGERGRLALMRLIKEGHNTLLLDEPTNHLDIRSCESLEASLADYSGTMVVVSHDRRFLDRVVERLIVFPDDGVGEVRQFLGNWSEWVRKRSEEKAAAADDPAAPRKSAKAAPTATTPTGRRTLSKNEQNRRLKKIAAVEERILELEAEKEEAVAAMGSGATDAEELQRLGRRCVEIDAEVEQLMGDWETWEREINEGLGPA
ncbi:MAG: ABC-F family ATP-binding cassette domain-containing protein [bacterium]|nr:ABC-F family ATP-binding cassette domain-containing protein [bacterium]